MPRNDTIEALAAAVACVIKIKPEQSTQAHTLELARKLGVTHEFDGMSAQEVASRLTARAVVRGIV